MKKIFLLSATLFSLSLFAQKPKEMYPTLGALINKSPQGEAAAQNKMKGCEALWRKAEEKGGVENLSAAEQKQMNACDEGEIQGYWDAVSLGCSWYCGGGPDTVYASSQLASQSGISYDGVNAHDLDYRTAWVEGVPGYGVGESVTYHFSPTSPRITKIIVVNGYVKSEKAWRENSRVKKLKVYFRDKPIAILNLKDNRNEQKFTFSPIGNQNRDDWDSLMTQPDWTLRFEIMEVYKGEKFDETAISEIFFEGVDVHCFGAGTKITMADGSMQNIETLQAGDKVLTYDAQQQKLVPVAVTKLIATHHSNMLRLTLEDREVIVTDDHPFLTANCQWASVNPARSNANYMQGSPVASLRMGSQIFIPAEKRFSAIRRIERIPGSQPAYTIELSHGDSFVANGLLVKTEEVK